LNDGSRLCPNVTVSSVEISAEVYNFKKVNEVLENQVKNCDVEKVKTEPELMNTQNSLAQPQLKGREIFTNLDELLEFFIVFISINVETRN
jgi:hypothetical protein